MSKVSRLDAHLGYWLRQLSNHVSQEFARKLAGEGVTVAEWVMMRVLFDASAVAPSRVAEIMGFTRGAVSKLADRLVVKGLALRAADPEDGRGQTLALSPEGMRLTPRLAALADANEAECFGALDPAQRAALSALVREAVARLGLKTPPVD